MYQVDQRLECALVHMQETPFDQTISERYTLQAHGWRRPFTWLAWPVLADQEQLRPLFRAVRHVDAHVPRRRSSSTGAWYCF
jgi:hypothetical protein